MRNTLIRRIEKDISAENMLVHVKEINQHDRWFTYPQFRRTADFCRRAFKDYCRLSSIKTFKLEANGRTRYGDYVIPRAWDAQEATLAITEPRWARRTLASYRNTPNALFTYSAPTPPSGVEAEIVRVKGGNRREDYREMNAKGKLVYTSVAPHFGMWRFAAERGAIGVVNNWKKGVQWENYFFVPDNRRRMFGFSIDERDAVFLEKLLETEKKRGGTVRVHARVETRLYDDTGETITGVIRGTSRGEVLVFAHLYEIGALDNASGAAAVIEIARCLNQLIERGILTRPRRDIRFMLGFECYSLMDYLLNRRKDASGIAAGLNLDQFGLPVRSETPLIITGIPDAAACFADTLLARIARDYFRRRNRKPYCRHSRGSAGGDGLPADPWFSVPFPILSQQVGPSGSWHNSLDTLDLVDPNTLKDCAAIAAAYLYFVADAGRSEALGLSRELLRGTRSILAKEGRDAILAAPRRADVDNVLDALKERLAYARDRGTRALRSVIRLADRDEEEGVRAAVLSAEQEAAAHARAQYAKVENRLYDRYRINRPIGAAYRPLNDLELKASRMIPKRKIPGILTLETLPEPVKTRNPYGVPGYQVLDLPLFWVDGKRNLLEAYRLYGQQGGARDLSNIVETFEFLARYGYVDLEYEKTITVGKADLKRGLARLGLGKGDVLLVHSSLSGLGYIEGGPATIVDVLKGTVGPRGTVVMPVFTYSGARSPFHPVRSRAGTGTVPEFFRRLPGVRRSGSPTHSVAACGRRAREMVRNHEDVPPYDIRGPFGKLYEHDAKIVFLGCQLYANSMFHAVEDWNDLPYLKSVSVKIRKGGGTRAKRYRKVPMGHRDFYRQSDEYTAKIYGELYARKLVRTVKVGKGAIRVIETRKMVDACSEILKHDPDILLCDRSTCEFCRAHRSNAR